MRSWLVLLSILCVPATRANDTPADAFWSYWEARYPFTALTEGHRPAEPSWVPMDIITFKKKLTTLSSTIDNNHILTPRQKRTLSWVVKAERQRSKVAEAHWQFNTVYHWIDLYQSAVHAHDFSDSEGQAYYREHLRHFPTLLQHYTAQLQDNIEQGANQTCYATETFLSDLQSKLTTGYWQQQLSAPLDTLTAVDKKNIDNNIEAVKRYSDFVAEHYLPACRDADKRITSLAQTDYATLLRYYTSTEMTPEEAVGMGMKQIKKLEAQLDRLRQAPSIQARWPASDQQGLLDAMRESASQAYTSYDDVMTESHTMLARIRERSSAYIRHPALMDTLTVTHIPKAAGLAAEAYYSSEQGKGTLYINAHNPAALRRYTLPSILVHETVPGHHYQQMRLQQQDVPTVFSRYYFHAQGEGWALYMERFTPELIATTPDEAAIIKLGVISEALLRAARLVIDVKLHTGEWTREKARMFLRKKTALSETSIAGAVERFLSLPGQATAYAAGVNTIETVAAQLKATHPDASWADIHEAILSHTTRPLSHIEPEQITLKTDTLTP